MSQDIKQLQDLRLNRATVEAISNDKDEPPWLRELRLSAFETYEATPMPGLRDEEWRRTDIRGLRLNQVVPYRPVSPRFSSLAPVVADAQAEAAAAEEIGGLLIQQDCGTVYGTLNDLVADQGVVFTDLDTAVREYPDLVRRYLATDVKPEYSKFSALNAAFWSGGVFLYVPRRVEIALPLQAITWLGTSGLSSFSRTLIVAEPRADVTLLDQWLGPDQDQQVMAANVQETFIGQGARVRHITLQEWGRHVWNFSINRTILDRDATANSLVVAFGGELHKANVESSLEGPGSNAEMLGLLFGAENQVFDHHTLQDHQAPHTSSDLLYKTALTDKGRSVFAGMIHARKLAQKTDAIQANRNLLLSKGSRADSIPNLEIEANDLRCTHAATVAPVDEEQLFYLQARALSEQDAKRIIVQGFFEPVLERIPLVGIVERLRRNISAKIGE